MLFRFSRLAPWSTRGSVVVMLAVLLVSGCARPIYNRGALPPQSAVAQLHPGESGRRDVQLLIGPPSTTSLFDQGETWYYIGSKQQQVAFYPIKEIDRRILAVHFSKAGVVEKIDAIGKEAGTTVTLVDRQTPTFGRQTNLLQQLFGNLGRLGGSRSDD